MPPRSGWLVPLLALLLAGAALAALTVGSVAIAPREVGSRLWAALLGGPGDDAADRILLLARLPRILLAMGVGATLALTGLSAQTLFRNPLASPSVIGISNGAALGAVAGMLLAGRLGAGTLGAATALSMAGGGLTTAIVFALGRQGQFFGQSLLLAGIAIGALCSSLTTAALYLAGERLQSIVFWLMGGLWQANWRDVGLMLPVTAVTAAILQLQSPAMDVLLLGDRAARDLGLNVRRLQRVLLLTIAVATSVAVSLTGVIAFIGLVVPHLLRLAVGAGHRRLAPASALGGALLLLVADTLARTLAAPAEIPVGIFTSAVGAPVFLWLLRRRQSALWP